MVSVVLAIAGIGATSVTTPAQAQTGRRCGFSSEFDPTQEGDTQTGEIHGGPIANDVNPGGTIEIICSIHVGAANSTHAGTAAVSVSSGASTAVAILAPTVVSYVAPFGQPVFMCTRVRLDNSQTLYYDDQNGAFVSSNTAVCGIALYQDLGVFGRCEISDPRLLCRMADGTFCVIYLGGNCLLTLPI